MLVINRRVGERIVIGNQVVITICDLGRSRVRVGIEAPKDIGVWREEILPPEHPLNTKGAHDARK